MFSLLLYFWTFFSEPKWNENKIYRKKNFSHVPNLVNDARLNEKKEHKIPILKFLKKKKVKETFEIYKRSQFLITLYQGFS